MKNWCYVTICIEYYLSNPLWTLSQSSLFVQVKKLRQGEVERYVQSHTTRQQETFDLPAHTSQLTTPLYTLYALPEL